MRDTLATQDAVFEAEKKILSQKQTKKVVEGDYIPSVTSEILGENHIAINEVDKRAYLSTLAISKYLVVTCDSTSMISEAAITGKPVYVEELPAKKNDYRFKKFRDLFTKLNIIKRLDKNLEDWTYKKLDEANRIAKEIKEKIY